MNLTTSFDDGVQSNGDWNPRIGERLTGGHALCVVGFDNNRRRFEVQNSWGQNWGNGGYFTISYDDYARYCKYGYVFTLEKNSFANESFSGTFEFKKFTGRDGNNRAIFQTITPILRTNYYAFPSTTIISKDDFFRIVASGIKKDNYVYIFSVKPDNSSEILFPLSLSTDQASIKDLPIVPSNNASIQIPVDDAKGISTDQRGTDYLCILYSSQPINNIQAIVSSVASGSGDFYGRLQSIIGDRLIPHEQINYSNSTMRFSANSISGNIAPIILRVNVQ